MLGQMNCDHVRSILNIHAQSTLLCHYSSHRLVSSSRYLDSASILEQVLELALLRLQITVSSNMFLRNEDVGYGRLARQIAERGLNRGSIICNTTSLATFFVQHPHSALSIYTTATLLSLFRGVYIPI